MNRVTVVLLLGVLLLLPASASAKLAARGSVEQVHVTGAAPGARVVLVDARGRTVARRRVGDLGALVFREVRPGKGYRVRSGRARSGRLTVMTRRSAPPSTKVYDQRLAEGYGYLTTRDGTKLAVNVQLPGPAEDGPYPTLVEYSGYGYANPAGGESSIAQIPRLLGYAVVGVNMRGTGCSGGAFDYFEPLQGLDGYDVIETVANQPWALHGRVGMVGVSYGGISQLFVGATRPPSLAAITPLSVIDDTANTLYPGGILNTGFAVSWAQDRVHDAEPASASGGQAWALQRIREGDRVCARNQALHGDAVDLIAETRRNAFYVPKVADPVSPITFVDEIAAPTFLACQWTDEQTGGHCPALAARFTGTDRKWFTFTNGVHTDSLDPATFNRWFDFLELYVARRAPRLPEATRSAAPLIYESVLGVQGVTLPDDPIQAQPSYEAALAAFEALPQVRVLFDNGAGAAPGLPVPAFERSFARWPIPETRARSWYLAPGGALGDAAPAASGSDTFRWDPSVRPATSFTGNTAGGPAGLWTATPAYRWAPNPSGTALSYATAPLTEDTTIVGGGALEAWIKAGARSVDLQVTVTEVRPDGNETFVQDGWLRTDRRKLDARRSTPLAPIPTQRRADAQPLRAGSWTKVTVPLYYQGHVYRAGSRLRVIVAAPGGDQPVWEFGDAQPGGTVAVQVANGAGTPSRLLMPEVPVGAAPTPLPPCPSLRGQPCRPYAP